MTKIGYAAMMEQFHPNDLVEWCAQAEEAGFEAGFMVSEHFHPGPPSRVRVDRLGVHGRLGQRTCVALRFGTAVTCPVSATTRP